MSHKWRALAIKIKIQNEIDKKFNKTRPGKYGDLGLKAHLLKISRQRLVKNTKVK
jgi:hypothetical protein